MTEKEYATGFTSIQAGSAGDSDELQRSCATSCLSYNVHVKYQRDVRSYRIAIQTREWIKPGKELPSTLRRLVEIWVEAHEQELLTQWYHARSSEQVTIVG